MFRNRISRYLDGHPEEKGEPGAPPVAPPGFAAAPISELPADVQESIARQRSIYELAYAQAQCKMPGDAS